MRLFEDGDLGIAREFRRALRQLASSSVERSGNGNQYGLLLERRFRVRGVPGMAQMQQILVRSLERRDFRNTIGRRKRQQRPSRVGALVRQPRLGGTHQAARVFDAARARQLADDVGRSRIPRQRERAFDELTRAGYI